MTKREVSRILARASKEEAAQIAACVHAGCNVQIMKQPQKTLVMVKARESIQKSLFYLGEVLATECMVLVDGVKGIGIVAGDDFEKAVSAAVIDGFLNQEGRQEEKQEILGRLLILERCQAEERAKMNRAVRKSKVNFNVMGE